MNTNKANAKKYYNLSNILKLDSQYNVLIGQRSNGKSYAVKTEVLTNAFKNDKEHEFVYLRRYSNNCTESNIIAYFSDMPVKTITGGKYEGVTVYRGNLYFCNYDEDYRAIKGKQIGRVVALNRAENYKSQAFPNVKYIIFEEFITDNTYLPDEPRQLMQLVSTIARDRDIKVFLIGNTISRVCPYFTEWQLKNIPKQEQGTIDTYEFKRYSDNGTEYITRISVENCESTGSSSKMFFGKVAEAITGGSWEVKEMPRLPRPLEEYTMLYELLFSDNGFSFVMQLLVNSDGGQIVYVYPFTGCRNIKRKITSVFSDDPLTTQGFNDKINAEVLMRTCIRQGKICYCNNLTGSDFEAVMMNRKGTL